MAEKNRAGEVTFTREQHAEGATLSLAAPALTVTWDAGGQLSLSLPTSDSTHVSGGPLLEASPTAARRLGLSGPVRFTASDELPAPVPLTDAQGSGLAVPCTFTAARLPIAAEVELRVYAERPAAILCMTLRNTGSEPIALRRAFPFVGGSWWAGGALRLAGRATSLSVYKNGWQSWSYAGGLPPEKSDPRPRVPTLVAWHSPGGQHPPQPYQGTVDVVSEEMGMLGASDLPAAMLTGFLSANHWLGQIYYQRREGAFAAAVLLDDYALAPDETLILPPLWLALGPQADLPPAYAKAVAAELDACVSHDVPTGWCSWYFYYTGISESRVVENLTSLRSLGQRVPVDLVQIDDGYQTAIGDWLSVNSKFPAGMAALAAEIRRTDYRPGIWLAPFTVAATSRTAREHPDWLVQSTTGKPAFAGHNWGTDLYALDTTHPEACDWLRTVFTTMVRQWGYDYLKLDFLACAAIEGIRHDPHATRASALRDGLALIREIVGDEVYILGCGCPLLSAVGLVDAMRIGPDSAPYWSPRYEGLPVPYGDGHSLPTMEGAIRNTLTRAWMHPTLWTNDPDCLLVRERRSELTLEEVRLFATAVGLTGGMVVVSDRLPDLPPDRLDILTRLLPPLPARALPDDYFAFGIPHRARVTLEGAAGAFHLVGLFNGSPRDSEVALTWSDLGLPRGIYHASEFWSGSYLGASSSGVSLRIAPHGVALLAIRPKTDEPALLSTSFHISQGACDVTAWRYDKERGEVAWRSSLGRTATGAFAIWLPPGRLPLRVTSGGRPLRWHRNPTGEIVVTAEVRGEAAMLLQLDGDGA